MSVELSLVIPAYNEADRLAAGFDRLRPFLDTVDADTLEVIVVDDGSSDDTMHRAHEVYGHLENARFVQQPENLGKGAALRLGIGLATGTNVVTIDADMAIDPRQLPLFMTSLRDSALVPGSRAIKGHINYDSRLRTFFGEGFNYLVRLYTRTSLRDTQCGCKGFQLGEARLLALLSFIDGFAFDVEVLYLANQLGLSVRPLLVTWEDVEGSSVRPGRDALAMFLDMRTVRSRRYKNPVVELATDTEAKDVAWVATEARLHGLVLAHSEANTLLVLGRNDALGGLGVAARLKGSLRTTTIGELKGRRFEAL
ncbi:MAG: Dolichyl-phosphate beta-glucosyltransferase [Acidimicrobiaceae bacterium]|nr:Dolichyl-phosphate beta-glucosyltransferase [Acidimicrobiaceae bacterium]